MHKASRVRGALASITLLPFAFWLAFGQAPAAAGQVLALRTIVNGSDVPLAGPVVIQNGTIMAPYQGLFDPLGIRATWNPEARALKLASPAGDEMELRAGDPYATVNGERRPVPIPLVVTLDQILIPVQWVFETLGDATAYDPANRILMIGPQITGISWRGTDAGLEVAIDGTGPLHPEPSILHNPERLVLDIAGAVARSTEPVDVHEGPLAAVRIGGSPFETRLVLNLTGPARYHLASQIPGRRIVVTLAAGPAPPSGPSGPAPYQPSAQKISDILYQHVDGGGRVVVLANQPLQIAQRTLRSPDRVVIDAQDAVFLPVKKFLDIGDGLVVQVRAAQFHSNPNIVRIVIELSRPSPFDVHPGPEAGQLLVDLGAAIAGPGSPAAGSHGPIVVAVDAGHGGSDPGAIGPTGVKEKDVVLAIAQALKRLLARLHFDVVMIRDADVFVPLEDRAQIAARGGATLFVSIHANAATDSNASGTQTFYSNPLSQPLAASVLEEVGRATGVATRGATQASFKVLVDSSDIPSILVETAFITNPHEEQLLRDPSVQQTMAQGVVRGIQRYLSMTQAPP